MFQRFSSRLDVQQNCNIQWLITKTNTVNKEIIIDLLTCKKVCFQLKEIYLQKKRICSQRKKICLQTQKKPMTNRHAKFSWQIATTNSSGKLPRQITKSL